MTQVPHRLLMRTEDSITWLEAFTVAPLLFYITFSGSPIFQQRAENRVIGTRLIKVCTYLSMQRLKEVTDGDLERGRAPRFNDESVINHVFAFDWAHRPYKILSPRYIGPDILREPPYINCGAQIPLSEIRIIHLEKCSQVHSYPHNSRNAHGR